LGAKHYAPEIHWLHAATNKKLSDNDNVNILFINSKKRMKMPKLQANCRVDSVGFCWPFQRYGKNIPQYHEFQ
jgi:hypothetical protein